MPKDPDGKKCNDVKVMPWESGRQTVGNSFLSAYDVVWYQIYTEKKKK